MRSSSALVLGALGVVALTSACSVTTTENSVTARSQPEFVNDKPVVKTSTKAWAGEEITIQNDGVNPIVGEGGLTITVDPAATTISVSADIVARADTETEAKLSIADAIATVTLDESNGKFAVSCGHGGAHGSSTAAASGCKRMRVTIPAGTAQQAHRLTVGNGSGDLTFSGPVTVSNLLVDNNGLGATDVRVIPVQGARMIITGEDAVTVRLPADFSADEVVLTIAPAAGLTPEQNYARIVTTDFPGMESNAAYGTGTTRAATLNAQTKGTFQDDTLTIRKL